MIVTERPFPPRTACELVKAGVAPVLARAWAARDIQRCLEVAGSSMEELVSYDRLKGAERMAEILADAISARKQMVVVADYDADGATACVATLQALRAFGGEIRYLMPDRIENGYGLTPSIVDEAARMTPRPEIIITVDNGIAAHAGIERANELGIEVLVTDHHLPADTEPAARCIVNPNQEGCTFPSKSLAGVGVIFYVMWALQDELVSRNMEFRDPGFDVTQLLPVVAVGTVADVVTLDHNNRTLIAMGLELIRKGQCPPGIVALAAVSSCSAKALTTSDIAFGVGPHLNAAGRLESMAEGVECLMEQSMDEALRRASTLHDINNRRKEIESEIVEEAVRRLLCDVQLDRKTVVLHASDWHAGVIGIVAGRIKEKVWRPVIILTSEKDGRLKGSGRSLPGFHLRDALDAVWKRYPGLIEKFGGHAMAAGLTLSPGSLEAFSAAFEEVASGLISPALLQQTIETDGDLTSEELTLETVRVIKSSVWGQGFPEPLFAGEFNVVRSQLIGEGKHLRLTLERDGQHYQAVRFRCSTLVPNGPVRIVYRPGENTFKGETNLQILVEHFIES